MLSCSDATRRISEALDRPLSWRARLGLRLHLMMCSACRRFARQVNGIERLLRGRRGRSETAASPDEDPQHLSPAAREAIKRSLRR